MRLMEIDEQKDLAPADPPAAEVSKRDRLKARLKDKYPDDDMDDDEVLAGRIYDDYDDYEGQLEGYKGREKEIAGLFGRDPRSASFISRWAGGEDPAVLLVETFGTEITDAIGDPEKQEQIAEANQKFLDRIANSEKLEKEYEENLSESLNVIGKLQNEGVPDEDIDKSMELLQNIVTDGVRGKFTRDTIEMALKAIGYDNAVAEAEETGRVAGRNEKIDVKLRKPEEGDGTANLSGGGSTPERPTPDLGALGEASTRKSIWDKGKMKRVKRE